MLGPSMPKALRFSKSEVAVIEGAVLELCGACEVGTLEGY